MTAASTALHPLLVGPRRAARVDVAVRAAAYLALVPPAGGPRPGLELALLTRDATRVPIGAVVPDGARAALATLRPGDIIDVGEGRIVLAGMELPVTRWFDPAVPSLPSLRGVPVDALARVQDRIAVTLPEPVVAALARLAVALGAAGGDPRKEGALEPPVVGLVGLGPGFTPAGDDVLCGALAALRAIRGDPPADAAGGRIGAAVGARTAATTAPSAALLQAARAGYALPALIALLRALAASRGHARDGAAVEAATLALLGVGDTSGACLAAGALAAAGAMRAGKGGTP